MTVSLGAAARARRISRALATKHLPANPGWHKRGRCRDVDPELFFAVTAGVGDRNHQPALRICEPCPVAAWCLAAALDRNETFGVWGGTTPTDRELMQPEWRELRSLAVAR